MRRGFLTCGAMTSLLAAFIVWTACGDDHHHSGTNRGGMSVQSIQPANGATCVDPSTTIKITFSRATNAKTVTPSAIQVADSHMTAVAGTISFDATSNTATFTPTSALTSNMVFTVTVTGVANTNGVTMSPPFTASF